MSENADFADEDFNRMMNHLFLFHHILILTVQLYLGGYELLAIIRLIQSMIGMNIQILQIAKY